MTSGPSSPARAGTTNAAIAPMTPSVATMASMMCLSSMPVLPLLEGRLVGKRRAVMAVATGACDGAYRMRDLRGRRWDGYISSNDNAQGENAMRGLHVGRVLLALLLGTSAAS